MKFVTNLIQDVTLLALHFGKLTFKLLFAIYLITFLLGAAL